MLFQLFRYIFCITTLLLVLSIPSNAQVTKNDTSIKFNGYYYGYLVMPRELDSRNGGLLTHFRLCDYYITISVYYFYKDGFYIHRNIYAVCDSNKIADALKEDNESALKTDYLEKRTALFYVGHYFLENDSISTKEYAKNTNYSRWLACRKGVIKNRDEIVFPDLINKWGKPYGNYLLKNGI